MRRTIDTYEHLNAASKFTVEIDIEELVAKVNKMNYGTHRFLSALVKLRQQLWPGDELGQGIETLLEKGFY